LARLVFFNMPIPIVKGKDDDEDDEDEFDTLLPE
jgi:hypothetical protein